MDCSKELFLCPVFLNVRTQIFKQESMGTSTTWKRSGMQEAVVAVQGLAEAPTS
jgi:hypothetical protein